MHKKAFAYVEDYLEYIAGISNPNATPIRLARYDVQIVASMAVQTLGGTAFTDKQAHLAHKVVVKYKRQLANIGIDLGSIEHQPQYRIPIRSVNRNKEIDIVNNKIVLRFPYDPEIISFVRETGKGIPGDLVFDHSQKNWIGSIVEPRLLWLEKLVDKYQFTLSSSVQIYLQKVKDLLNETYTIELKQRNDKLVISNAESSLTDYIEQNLGGFGLDNLIRLIDYSNILGYTIDKQLTEEHIKNFKLPVQQLLLKKESHLPLKDTDNLDHIIKYAELTDRFPIFVYEPNATDLSESSMARVLESKFGSSVLKLTPRQRKIDLGDYRCVHFNSRPPALNFQIPLLITLHGMMVGVKNQQLIQCSEKVVYGTESVYNSNLI